MPACVAPTSSELVASDSRVGVEEAPLVAGQVDPIRVQVILASYDDGAFAPFVTPEQIRTDLALATTIYAPASIRFEFDPQTDVARVNSTLLARECTLAPGAVVPSATEPACDFKSHNDERNRVAQTYPGKLVVYFSYSERTLHDGNQWTYGPKDYDWSNPFDSFVTMTLGDPGNALAHEMGHYLHLDHTFGATPGTVSEAQAAIKSYIESNNLPKARGTDIFDGDGLASTPPDPGPGLFIAAGLDPCNANQGTLTLPVTFSDKTTFTYAITPDREDIMNYWDKTCRGKQPDISADQIARVRDAIDVTNRTPLTDYRQIYSAVFEPAPTGQTRAIGWAQNDMVGRFDREIAGGKHLEHMQAYDIGGAQIRYDGVWTPGVRVTTRAFGWSINDFATRFNQEIAAGKHFVHMQAYDIGGGQIRYDGVWENGSQGTTRAIAWSLTDFAARFNQEIAAGKHLVHMQAYDIGGGQIRYDGVWENGDRGTHRALGWAFNDFVARNEQELAGGRRLAKFQEYDSGNGQIRYDGVWETSTVAQTHVFSETKDQFAARFDAQIAAGNHEVLMDSIRGR